MKRAELAEVLWRRHIRATPPDLDTLNTWIEEHGKARLERAFRLTGEKIASEWFNNRRVMSEDDAAAYAAGVLRNRAGQI